MILFVVPAKLGSSQVNDEYKTHLIASFVVMPNVPFNSNVFGAFITTVFDETNVTFGLIIEILKPGILKT